MHVLSTPKKSRPPRRQRGPTKAYPAVPNPWGLLPREAAVLDAVIVSGSNRGAAALLGKSIKTIEVLKSDGLLKMGTDPTLTRLLTWFLFRQDVLRPGVAAAFRGPRQNRLAV